MLKKMIDMLFANNGNANEAEDLSPLFECPSEKYYTYVCLFIDKKGFLSMSTRVITILS